MAEKTYLIWDYEEVGYWTDQPLCTTLDIDRAARFTSRQVAIFSYKLSPKNGRAEIDWAISPECGGNPTFHLPLPENPAPDALSEKAISIGLETLAKAESMNALNNLFGMYKHRAQATSKEVMSQFQATYDKRLRQLAGK